MGPLRAAAVALEFGFIVGGFVTTGVLVGRFLDDQFGTRPLIFLAGVLLGLGSSFYVFVLLFQWQKRA